MEKLPSDKVFKGQKKIIEMQDQGEKLERLL